MNFQSTEPVVVEQRQAALEAIAAGVAANRRESLRRAIELGASDDTLVILRDASLLARGPRVVLPYLRYESLSRGRGWARKGRGDAVAWGERVDRGYRVGPGRWIVGATDGFSRKASATWNVRHIPVGNETWTIAN